MDDKPRRRWFQFRLRTLFVAVALLSVPLAWVGYQLEWIRERHVYLDRTFGEYWRWEVPDGAPGCLWLFGEKGHLLVNWYGDLGDAELTLENVRRLFPEADVVAWGSDGTATAYLTTHAPLRP